MTPIERKAPAFVFAAQSSSEGDPPTTLRRHLTRGIASGLKRSGLRFLLAREPHRTARRETRRYFSVHQRGSPADAVKLKPPSCETCRGRRQTGRKSDCAGNEAGAARPDNKVIAEPFLPAPWGVRFSGCQTVVVRCASCWPRRRRRSRGQKDPNQPGDMTNCGPLGLGRRSNRRLPDCQTVDAARLRSKSWTCHFSLYSIRYKGGTGNSCGCRRGGVRSGRVKRDFPAYVGAERALEPIHQTILLVRSCTPGESGRQR